jgi:hypothetical protein
MSSHTMSDSWFSLAPQPKLKEPFPFEERRARPRKLPVMEGNLAPMLAGSQRRMKILMKRTERWYLRLLLLRAALTLRDHPGAGGAGAIHHPADQDNILTHSIHVEDDTTLNAIPFQTLFLAMFLVELVHYLS